MRKVAMIRNKGCDAKRVMVYAAPAPQGVYLFIYNIEEDGAAIADEWYATVTEVDRICVQIYGIEPEYWKQIDDPVEGCQHDWIAPVRVRGRNTGNPEWSVFERLENGAWHKVI